MSHSILQLFPPLEGFIRAYVPRCQFFFGEDDNNRNAQPPKIIWDIDGGDPTGFERQSAVSGAVYPKAFAADMVQIVAIVMGAAAPSTATNEKTPRQQDFAATEELAQALRWALRKGEDGGALGKHTWHGWTNTTPTTSERGCIWECRFEIKEQVVAPEPLISDPPHTVTTASVSLETP